MLRCDHLLYTGNTHIGRKVALKVAENLVPSRWSWAGCGA
jgi:hypothetical protein